MFGEFLRAIALYASLQLYPMDSDQGPTCQQHDLTLLLCSYMMSELNPGADSLASFLLLLAELDIFES